MRKITCKNCAVFGFDYIGAGLCNSCQWDEIYKLRKLGFKNNKSLYYPLNINKAVNNPHNYISCYIHKRSYLKTETCIYCEKEGLT